MRYDHDHKARTRERVLDEAAAMIRAEGVEHVSVAAIMAAAGLTHGGFYAHFKSKDDLVGQAIGRMFEQRYAALLERLDTPDPAAALAGFINTYLSLGHRDTLGRACPIPLLSGDLPRLPEAARQSFVTGVERLARGVATLLEKTGVPDAMAEASSAIAELIGAISLARAQPDPDSAERILAISRAKVKKRLQLTVDA